MKRVCSQRVLSGLVAFVGALFIDFDVDEVEAQTTNSWTNPGDEYWDNAANWSLGVAPSLSQAATLITNAGPKNVIIDTFTVTNFPGTLSISNLTVTGDGGDFNVLALAEMNAAAIPVPLRVVNSVRLGSNGALVVINSELRVEAKSGGEFTIDGTAQQSSGKIVVTNSATTVGKARMGLLTILDGTFLGLDLTVSSNAFSAGTLSVEGGTLTLLGRMRIGRDAAGTGTVWMTGGELNVTNDSLRVGNEGTGMMTMSNGIVRSGPAYVAGFTGSRGTLTVAGGSFSCSELYVAQGGATGTVWVTGGELTASNSLYMAASGVGQVVVSNGTVRTGSTFVGFNPGSQGTLTVAGGTNQFAGLFVADFSASTGRVWLTGGQLFAMPFASVVGYLGDGQMTMSNGAFVAQTLTVGYGSGGNGTFTMASGSALVSNTFVVGDLTNATGAVWLSGGQLTATNATTTIGDRGTGILTISNGTLLTRDLTICTNGSSQGTLKIAGGSVTALGRMRIGRDLATTGNVWVTAGQLTVTNDEIRVGNEGHGQLTLSNGTVQAAGQRVAFSSGAAGTLTIAGGTNSLSSPLTAGNFSGSTGTVWLTGGYLLQELVSPFVLGLDGVARMTVSSGVFRTIQATVAQNAGSQGTLTFAGGTNVFSPFLIIGFLSGSTGNVWMTDGALTAGAIDLALQGTGRMTVSNGTVRTEEIVVGFDLGSQGTLTVAGGITVATNDLVVGWSGCASTGIVNVVSGTLAVTNAAGNAVLDVRGGTFTQSGGTLLVDRLYVTNACARFLRSGGALFVGSLNLAGNLDADGDGIPNSFDLDPFDPADAGQDPDGDGFTNLQEYLAGTNPSNSTSALRITAIAREGNDIRLTWMTVGGKTNALERSTQSLTNYAAIFAITNTIAGTTNFTDIGAASLSNAFYRVRLVP